MNRRSFATLFTLLTLIFLPLTPPANAGWDPREDTDASKSNTGNRAVDEAITRLKSKDPGMKLFFKKAYGYAIFPTVGKAGIGLGGAYGEGEVYRQGRFIGTSSLSQITIGFQLGGQAYTEIIFFKDKRALEDFTSGNFEFNAQASAVAVTAGASADADYDNGVAIFTMPKGGLMYEATVGGQKFSFKPAR
ncbi:lipid-binding SYLF domain-containing protein [Sedimenticola hydrogenitrophicus]|uniref:lipid-binding SYLF domain-containing protein n=1 Tax=Sedimenticola hydrogenitrophicus TaxID=2967975 RepID=UPI0023B1ED16|nr:lipid-binding SYLF domain-containing protein [Sedimenticola hydrogenitrophicus]